MSPTRRSILSHKKTLLAATCVAGALSTQVLACDPMPPPAREPPGATSATPDGGSPPPATAPDAGH